MDLATITADKALSIFVNEQIEEGKTLNEVVDMVKSSMVSKLAVKHRGNQTQVARQLVTNRSTVRKILKGKK